MLTFTEELAEQIFKNPQFHQDFLDLVSFSIKHNFSQFLGINQVRQNEFSYDLALKRLGESALILASSPNEDHKKFAFEVGTLLYENYKRKGMDLSGFMKVLCTRLENIPALNLVKSVAKLPINLEFEHNLVTAEHTVTIIDQKYVLTHYQLEVLNLLRSGLSLSLSAPTSAGKTFIVNQFLVEKFHNSDKFRAVIIVPTRALIRQFVIDFRDAMTKNILKNGEAANNNFVQILTSGVEEVINLPRKCLFVVTPERLQTILYSWNSSPNFNLAIIDESQKVNDDERGIILEDTISELVHRQSRIQTVFLSPLTSNPEFLFDLVNITKSKQPVRTTLSPVAQCIYSVKTKQDANGSLIISRIEGNDEKYICTLQTNSKIPTKKTERRAYIAHHLGNGSSNLIYSNSSSEAFKTALAFLKLPSVKNSKRNEAEISDTIDALRIYVHRDYDLIKCIRKGVGYHFGDMPDIARTAVEDLIKSEEITFVACTSTLLAGINLPAKNIFIDEPRLGKKAMDSGSFWNLAGRAGRMNSHLSGNVFCIDQDQWDNPITELLKDTKIESSLNRTVASDSFYTYCGQTNLEANKHVDPKLIIWEQAFNSILIRYKRDGKNSAIKFLMRKIPLDRARAIIAQVGAISDQITIPIEFLKRNKSIDFRKQQIFYKYLETLSDDELINLAPKNPFMENFLESIRRSFEKMDEYFSSKDRGAQFKHFSFLANSWIREETLNVIIDDEIQRIKEDNKRKNKRVKTDPNDIIRKIVEEINDDIRYHYVKCSKCFCDLIRFEIINRRLIKPESLVFIDFGLPNYLELGMYKQGTITLHNLGLSRTASIVISTYCRSIGVIEDDILDYLRQNSMDVASQLQRPLRFEFLHYFG